MIIAVASNQGRIADHFGYAQEFILFQIEDKNLVSQNNIANPGHKPGFLPVYLADLNVKVIISAGMGASAVNLFNQRNIEVITGVSGQSEMVVQDYLLGKLKPTGNICHQHDQADDSDESA
ncbi:MAG: dinitrogenase iron-molybdenum cofactor [Firmicutes bacterium]|jgi:predicted Fe-Mo cluster-binding NifX family protein|nr:dinitrogenase iron-molybdenum cofactor [Bacillota bacterium]